MKSAGEILIKNGNVVFENDVLKTDILVRNGTINKFGNIESDTAEILDAEGCFVFPGFIDMHTHLDDAIGKYYLADTYSTASEIALENGVTTLFNFITQKNGNTLIQELELALEKLEYQKKILAEQNKELCNTAFHLTPVTFSEDDWNDIEYLISIGFKTFKFYTTYRNAGLFTPYDKLEEIVNRLKDYDVTALIHCEDNEIIESADTRKNDLSKAFTHALLRPSEAEITAVKRILSIADKTGARIHIVHVSTCEAAELINEFRKTHNNVTCETCPQYLFLDEEKLKTPGGHRFICSPPLRSPENRNKMAEMARKGHFDVFATDHCAFTKKDKDCFTGDIRDVPSGLPGIGALPGLVFNLYGDIDIKNALEISGRLSLNPALITGLYPMKGTIKEESDADLVILNSGRENDIVSTHSFCYEMYTGMKTKMNIKYTLLKGRIVFEQKTT